LSDDDQPVVAMVAGLSSKTGIVLKSPPSARLSAFNRLLRRGEFRGSRYARTSLKQLEWLGGLSGAPQHDDRGTQLTRASLQAAEQQGRMIQL